MKNLKAGFSLLEVVLTIGIFALATTLFTGWVGTQATAESRNQDLVESTEIIDDFCTFIEISSFDDIKALANAHSTLYVTQEEEDGILYRKFVPNSNLKPVDSVNQLGFAVEIESLKPLFADENSASRFYIPLACKLFKIGQNSNVRVQNSIDEKFFTFIAVKNY
ncbi:MAG: type II secretion system GspH family protein [Puniceicoccales bacterium]|jgi:hypothetical protein|nr:type II secretion system GspH family protein [Puniceicoccales bacterium]